MRRILFLLTALSLVLTACAKSDLRSGGGNAEVATTATSDSDSQEPVGTGEPEQSGVLEEIPLADGAVLIVEKSSEHEDMIRGLILYQDSDETELLFYTWKEHFKISQDLTKVACLTYADRYQHRGNVVEIFDVLERKFITEPKFNECSLREKPTENDMGTIQLVWLDDEIILVIRAWRHGSATMGGCLYYYNITDGSNMRIAPQGSHFQLVDLEIDNENLNLTIAVHEGGANQWKIYYDSIPLQNIYELIENREMLMLDVPNFDEIDE